MVSKNSCLTSQKGLDEQNQFSGTYHTQERLGN